MKRYRDQYSPVPAASMFHEAVREIFCSSDFFRDMSCFQEVPVHEIFPDYPDKLQRYDWYIKELKCVIELHGNQHYNFTNRGNIAFETADKIFFDQQSRDLGKKVIAEENGITYIEIPYKYFKKLTPEFLKNYIIGACNGRRIG